MKKESSNIDGKVLKGTSPLPSEQINESVQCCDISTAASKAALQEAGHTQLLTVEVEDYNVKVEKVTTHTETMQLHSEENQSDNSKASQPLGENDRKETLPDP